MNYNKKTHEGNVFHFPKVQSASNKIQSTCVKNRDKIKHHLLECHSNAIAFSSLCAVEDNILSEWAAEYETYKHDV